MNELLLGKSTEKRRKEAIRIQKDISKGKGFCEDLEKALKIEEGSKSWQTKVELIKAIAIAGCRSCSDYIYDIYIQQEQEDHSMLAHVASSAYFRLKRNTLNDVSIALTLFKLNKYSVTEGILDVLGYDKVVPSEKDQKLIIKECWDFGKNRHRGYTDPRYGLAASCAGWTLDITKEFLEYCLLSNDTPLIYVATNALKGKYVKLR